MTDPDLVYLVASHNGPDPDIASFRIVTYEQATKDGLARRGNPSVRLMPREVAEQIIAQRAAWADALTAWEEQPTVRMTMRPAFVVEEPVTPSFQSVRWEREE